MRTTLAVLAAMAAFVAADEQHCDPSYDCEFFEETSSDLWYWDFTSLCSATEYTYPDPNPTLNSTFHFNICGYTQTKCIPPDWQNPYEVGVAIQMWGNTPACTNPPACTDNTGAKVCCTAECELLGYGYPIFELVDPNNPKTGGINITHLSVPASDLDPNECPYDPSKGGFISRSVEFNFQCDPNGSKGSFRVLNAYEGPQCHYNLVLSSVHGCGKIYDGPDSFKSAGGAIAGAFFGGLFTCLAIGGAAYWYFFVYKKSGYSGFGAGASSTASSSSSFKASTSYSAVGSN